jgi:hypothetical protein
MSSRPKASGTKRDSSTALFSLQDTNISKQHKDDNFPFKFDKAFEIDVDKFLALDSTVQTFKFKSFFAKLEEEAICFISEKAFMMMKIEKAEKEIENRATLHSDLNQAKKDLLTAKLSLADKDIRLFELQSSVKSISLQPSNEQFFDSEKHLLVCRGNSKTSLYRSCRGQRLFAYERNLK